MMINYDSVVVVHCYDDDSEDVVHDYFDDVCLWIEETRYADVTYDVVSFLLQTIEMYLVVMKR